MLLYDYYNSFAKLQTQMDVEVEDSDVQSYPAFHFHCLFPDGFFQFIGRLFLSVDGLFLCFI